MWIKKQAKHPGPDKTKWLPRAATIKPGDTVLVRGRFPDWTWVEVLDVEPSGGGFHTVLTLKDHGTFEIFNGERVEIKKSLVAA